MKITVGLGKQPQGVTMAIRFQRKPHRRLAVANLKYMNAAQKFEYALRMCNLMRYNPGFADGQKLVEALSEIVCELNDAHEKYLADNSNIELMNRKEKLLDLHLNLMHQYIQSIHDKEIRFILCAGMHPILIDKRYSAESSAVAQRQERATDRVCSSKLSEKEDRSFAWSKVKDKIQRKLVNFKLYLK